MPPDNVAVELAALRAELSSLAARIDPPKRRHGGRPNISLRLLDDEIKAVDRAAAAMGLNRAAYMRYVLAKALGVEFKRRSEMPGWLAASLARRKKPQHHDTTVSRDDAARQIVRLDHQRRSLLKSLDGATSTYAQAPDGRLSETPLTRPLPKTATS